MAEDAWWNVVARQAQGGPAPLRRRERAVSVVLAVLVQLAFIFIWVRETHVDAPRGRSGSRGVVQMRLWSLAGTPPRGAIHPNARRATRTPAPAKETPRRAPKSEGIDMDRPWVLPPPPVRTPEEPKKAEPEEPPAMSERDVEEFNRQWAQLQGDMKQKALDDAEHHELKVDLSATTKTYQKFGPAQPGPADQDRKIDAAPHRRADDNSMFAGELCVSRAGSDGELLLALPCIGDNYTTDFGWQSRVHAPKRGEPMAGALDPTGRVMVRNYPFSTETLTAFEEAQAELHKIQVTMRMIYLPDLKVPIQLLSRDDRVGAISAQAFPSEHELAVYLSEWAANVHRWTTHENPDNASAAALYSAPVVRSNAAQN
jgi:hypothetical protein